MLDSLKHIGHQQSREATMEDAKRPRSLADVHGCGVEFRPCPRVTCRHHLGAGEKEGKFARRGDCSETCSLDVAARGPLGLVEVGRLIGQGRARVQQIEARALRKLAESPAARALFKDARGNDDEHPPILETLPARFSESVRNHWT